MSAHRSTTNRASGERGFTLSEFALVLVVLVGLITIVVVSVNGIDDESAERECRSELRAIKAASERFKAELTIYPPNDEALRDAGYLELADTPNYKVVTAERDGLPVYETVGDRCA